MVAEIIFIGIIFKIIFLIGYITFSVDYHLPAAHDDTPINYFDSFDEFNHYCYRSFIHIIDYLVLVYDRMILSICRSDVTRRLWRYGPHGDQLQDQYHTDVFSRPPPFC